MGLLHVAAVQPMLTDVDGSNNTLDAFLLWIHMIQEAGGQHLMVINHWADRIHMTRHGYSYHGHCNSQEKANKQYL